MKLKSEIEAYFEREKEVISLLDTDEISKAVNAIADAGRRGSVIWTMGNGGSASTASHMVCDLSKGVYEGSRDKKFDVRCLCDNASVMLAISNDIGYKNIFRYQLEGLLKPDDVVVAISGSGNSENVVSAAEYAHDIGAVVVAVTGYSGGKLKEMADYNMHVPVDDMQIAEDIHMIFNHMMMRVLSGKDDFYRSEVKNRV